MTTFQPPSPSLFPLPPVSIGDKITITYAKGNFNNCTYHVRGFVDGRIVLAKWDRRKKCYTYSVKTGIWWSYAKTYAKIKKAKVCPAYGLVTFKPKETIDKGVFVA